MYSSFIKIFVGVKFVIPATAYCTILLLSANVQEATVGVYGAKYNRILISRLSLSSFRIDKSDGIIFS